MDATEKNSLEKQYGTTIVQRMERQKRIQRVLLWISVVSFAGTSIFGFGKVFKGVFDKEPKPTESVQQSSQAELLNKQEKGYESVLKREPNNQTALEELTKIRIQQNDIQGAIEPLEKLVKLHPDRQDYQQLLTQLKQGNLK